MWYIGLTYLRLVQIQVQIVAHLDMSSAIWSSLKKRWRKQCQHAGCARKRKFTTHTKECHASRFYPTLGLDPKPPLGFWMCSLRPVICFLLGLHWLQPPICDAVAPKIVLFLQQCPMELIDLSGKFLLEAMFENLDLPQPHYFTHALEQGGYVSIVEFYPTREYLRNASGWVLLSSRTCKDGASSMNSAAARAIRCLSITTMTSCSKHKRPLQPSQIWWFRKTLR